VVREGVDVAEVLSVVQNWRRPANVARIVEAIRSQSVPSRLAIVDCAFGTEYTLPPDVLRQADDVFIIGPNNLSPCCRFIPSTMIPEVPLTMFWLDDFLPGPQCLESFLRHRELLENGEASTLGQDGRIFADDSSIVRRRMHVEPDCVRAADVIVSSELCLTRNVSRAIRFRDDMVNEYGAENLSLFEDDLWLCLGIRRSLKCRSAVFPTLDVLESCRWQRLPAPHALASRPDHDARRADLVRKILKWTQS